jgi:NDP-hexose 4-ketoreductase
MKVLVFGSSGFIGKTVCEELSSGHDIYKGDRLGDGTENSFSVDLLDQDSIVTLLEKLKPEVIINCAGTVENSEKAFSINPIITLNILQSIVLIGLPVKRVITSGSAGEYGIVAKVGAVPEETPLMGTSPYARSKILESSVAIAFAKAQGLPVVVTRIFNPIGVGMHPRFLLPNLIMQVSEIKRGNRKQIELSRLDALRDYVNILDIATAIRQIVEKDCPHDTYNIGSGNPITNKDLLEGILRQQGISASDFTLVETSETKEPNYAVNANISRLVSDFGWSPAYDIHETIKQITENIFSKESDNE